MSKAWKAATAVLFFLLLFSSRTGAQVREVDDTPKRYRELMKDPRVRAALKGEKVSDSPVRKKGSPPKGGGPERSPAGGKEKKSAEKGAGKPDSGLPPRLRLPAPPPAETLHSRPGTRRSGNPESLEARRGAALPSMGDEALWPWDSSLVGGGEKGKGRKGPASRTGEETRAEGTPDRPSQASPVLPSSHTLFGGQDQPGLFLGVDGEDADGASEKETTPIPGTGPARARGEEKGLGNREGEEVFFPAPPPSGGRHEGERAASSPPPAGRAATELPPAAASGGKTSAQAPEPRGAKEAEKVLDRMFLALGGRTAFLALGGLHASIRIAAYDRMGAEVFARSAEQETSTGPFRGDRVDFDGGPTLGRKGEAFWASFCGVERPDMVPRAREELQVLSFLLRFPFSLAEGGGFHPVSARRVKQGGQEMIELVLEGAGGRNVLFLEPTTCIPREMLYAPLGGRKVRILFSDWRNLQGVVFPSRKAVLSPGGKRVSLEIRVLQVLGGFRWGPEHFLPAGKSG